MAYSESNNEVVSYLLNKSAKAGDWQKVNQISEENSTILSDQELGLWIRSKFMLGDYDGCHELCQKIVPKQRSLLKEKCRFMLRSSVKLSNKKMIKNSIEYYEKIFPDNIDYKIEKIKLLYSDNNHDECISVSEQILKSDLENQIALKYIARSLTKQNSNEERIQDAWNSIIALDPSNLEAINNLARVMISKQKLIEASELIDKLFQLNPNYVPGLASLAKLKQISKKVGFDNEITSKDNYRTLYSERKYVETIEKLGGITNSFQWTDDESIFVFRSLSRLERYEDSVNLFKENQDKYYNIQQILVEVASSAKEINDEQTKNSILSKLHKHSQSDITSAKFFLQYLLSSNQDNNYFIQVFENFYDLYGDIILEYTISLILKEQKFELFSSSEIFEGATSLLDPIHGTLRQKIGDSGLNSIFNENKENYLQALATDKSRFTPSQYSFMNSCINSDLPYLVSEIIEINSDHAESGSNEKIISEIPKTDMENYCDIIRKHSLVFDDNQVDKNSIILCSNLDNYQHFLGSKKEKASRISIVSNEKNIIGRIERYSKNGRFTESEISSDPRIILGRFFSLLEGLKTIDKMVISWISSTIFSSKNSEVWYDNSLPHAKIAAVILGFPDEHIISISERL